MERLEKKSGEGKVANFLHFKITIDLLKLGAFMKSLFEFVKDKRMGVDVSVVVIHCVLVKVLENHITNLTIIPFQMSIAPTLPAKQIFQFSAP